MSRINSRQKGVAAERELAKLLAEVLGCEARRGQQFSGGTDSPDVVTDIPGIHWEVKRTERLNLKEAQDQACRDAGVHQVPTVAHRYNRRGWWAMLQVKDLPAFCKRIVEFMEGEK